MTFSVVVGTMSIVSYTKYAFDSVQTIARLYDNTFGIVLQMMAIVILLLSVHAEYAFHLLQTVARLNLIHLVRKKIKYILATMRRSQSHNTNGAVSSVVRTMTIPMTHLALDSTFYLVQTIARLYDNTFGVVL